MKEMYYTVPDMRLLIRPEMSVWFYVTSILCLLLTSMTLLANSAPRALHTFAENNPQLLSLLVCYMSCILCGFCTFLAMQASDDVGKFAFKATPRQFQEASYWYFIRLRASAVHQRLNSVILFTMQSVLEMIMLCVLYLGIQCRYRSFNKLSQKPDIAMPNKLFV
uniref:ABC-2 type transporter domain-containing protein n=1 Tax=Angiostrongylus cantonensis TaxID=6313 RepID=A0A0K0DBL8_ANGCA